MSPKTFLEPVNRRERRHPELIGLQEAADRCGVSYRTVRRWISDGRINAVRVGPKLLKISVSDLDRIVQPVGGAA
jgi:excisionase family DNA binding protein